MEAILVRENCGFSTSELPRELIGFAEPVVVNNFWSDLQCPKCGKGLRLVPQQKSLDSD
jgi:hypothetical protein